MTEKEFSRRRLMKMGIGAATTSALVSTTGITLAHALDPTAGRAVGEKMTKGKEDIPIPYGYLDLTWALSKHLESLQMKDKVSIRVVRRSSGECPPGRMSWAIEIEEPDESLKPTTRNRTPRVLLVGNSDLQELYSMQLEQAGCKVDTTSDGNAAMQLCVDNSYDIVLLESLVWLRLIDRIRTRNPDQAIALLGTCGATGCRFHYKIPILRPPFPPEQLVRLVESAIKPEVRVLLVAGDPDEIRRGNRGQYIGGDLWSLVTSYPTSFEIELQSNGDDALRRYRERGPYDMVLTGYRIAGMVGADLALAIRRENPAQRIAVITEQRPEVVRSIKRKLRGIPLLTGDELFAAMREQRKGQFYYEREGQRFIDAVEAAIKAKREGNKSKKRSRREA